MDLLGNVLFLAQTLPAGTLFVALTSSGPWVLPVSLPHVTLAALAAVPINLLFALVLYRAAVARLERMRASDIE